MGIPDATHVAFMKALDEAIYSISCPYCGSEKGKQCMQNPRSDKIRLMAATNTPHMGRVRAGHMILKARN